jgi:8-oxo-dGTP pyrophosphatase MutT (NUDIX family)
MTVSRRNPWTTLDSRIVLANPVVQDSRGRRDPPRREPRHLHDLLARNAVGVVPCFSDGTILLVGQYRYSIARYSWEIPEGGGEDGESPRQTARRELAEETGYRARIFRSLGCFHTSNCFTDETAYLYYATGLTPGVGRPDGTERLVSRRIQFTRACDMAVRGAITDSITIVALFRLLARRSLRRARRR